MALQIAVVGAIAVGSWSYFGSPVVSFAMLGRAIASVFISMKKGTLDRHGEGPDSLALTSFGPLAVKAIRIFNA
jgi:hypothetical protein